MAIAITAIAAAAVVWNSSQRLRAWAYAGAARAAGRTHSWLVTRARNRPAPTDIPTAAEVMRCWVALYA